ncbi:uncharacterized protein JN550_000843 [Neoarthrinium moseri]|uniref:uncharacterized protein n=1 Tax=Neoarthrinium moseri TaxID=1658444 RepID=UPI001FDC0BE5|nr:uncharacterized protein JN550_000843 [Neoarthrinium moseri]KAI1876771.1 hypothetical protein JN550_000843 [Neoarthrinium moseri]
MELAIAYIVEAFHNMGRSQARLHEGVHIIDIPALSKHIKVKYRMYQILEHNNLIKQDVAGAQLADSLTGRSDPLPILFGTAKARTLMENVYTHAPMFRAGTITLARYLVKVINTFSESRPIRILERVAGTDRTAKCLVESLAATEQSFQYTFTDLSALFVVAARQKFAQHDFMQYSVLDIEEEPAAQFLNKFGIVISTNCMHATRDLTQTCTNINKCLRPGGVLCLVELTRNLPWSSPSAVVNPITMETVTMKRVGGVALELNIYYPEEQDCGDQARPVAPTIHEGGHVMLLRKDICPSQARMLLAARFLPVSVDYRLFPETTLLDGPMQDVCDALAWARSVLPTLSLRRAGIRADGTRVFAVGWSTGGHLALTLGFTAPSRGIQPPEAILALYCPTDYEGPFCRRPNLPFSHEVDTRLQYNLLEGLYDRPITAYNPPSTKRALGGWMSPTDPRSRITPHMN